MKFMTTADKLLILFLVVASIASIFAIPRLLNTEAEGKKIIVNLDGEVIYTFPLVDSEESELIEFDFTYGSQEYTGTLEMKDGRVKLHRLPEGISPLSIHTDMGWISEPYQVIICLPIKLFITIETTTPEEQPFDIISF
ncbi:NusG domain II-containing protein [Alkaliphilus crotonatoxidans]